VPGWTPRAAVKCPSLPLSRRNSRKLREMMLASTRIFADETVVPVLDPTFAAEGHAWPICQLNGRLNREPSTTSPPERAAPPPDRAEQPQPHPQQRQRARLRDLGNAQAFLRRLDLDDQRWVKRVADEDPVGVGWGIVGGGVGEEIG
jgi:hypothetical protein